MSQVVLREAIIGLFVEKERFTRKEFFENGRVGKS
jgi:hypothetical protein